MTKDRRASTRTEDTAAVPTPRGPAAVALNGATAVRADAGPPAGSATAHAALAAIGLICAGGLTIVAIDEAGIAAVFPAAAATAFGLCALTLLLGYGLLRRARSVRPPGAAVSLAAVAWGLFGATGLALPTNNAIDALLANSGLNGRAAEGWGVLLRGPVTEELFKLAGIVLLALAFARALRGPIEGFVIGALVGLGFQVAENFYFAITAVVDGGGVGGMGAAVGSVLLRVVLTGVGTHWALSALAGTAVGLMAANAWRIDGWRVPTALLLVLTAIVLHTSVNAPVFTAGMGVGYKALFNFAVVTAVYFVLRHCFRRRVRAALADEAGSSGLDPGEAAALARRRGRRRMLRAAPKADRGILAKFQERLVDAAEDRALLARD